jgi:uncharacterized membrane protein YfcA
LSSLAKSEATHWQWVKQGLNVSLIFMLIFMNLAMGSKSKDSIIGIQLCSAWFWIIQLVFIGICVLITWYAVRMNKREQELRKLYDVNYDPTEVIYEGRVLRILLTYGFLGGWVAGALGLGGGSIYNPALLSLGVNPRVASSTGMYLVLFTAINATVVNWVSGTLNFAYSGWIGTWSVIGSIIGFILAEAYVKKSGRQSFFVWILFVVFVLSVIVTPIAAYFSLKKDKEAGHNLMAFESPC